MADMTTEQRIPFTFEVDDFRGVAKGIDGDPVGASSDETIATVVITAVDATHWTGFINATGLAGTCNITVSADTDASSAVNTVVGTAEVNVTLDTRTGSRVIKLDLGAAEDKPVT